MRTNKFRLMLNVTMAGILLVPAFAVAPSSFKLLYALKGGNNPGHPYDGVIFDAAGNLYGTTVEGGALTCDDGPCGTVFRLTPKSGGIWSESTIYRFAGGTDGWGPFASLTTDGGGNLYGTTGSGGSGSGGTVFDLKQNSNGGWTHSVAYNFCQLTKCADGAGPTGTLILDNVGNLYGTTTAGGSLGGGTAFKLAPNSNGSWTESVINNFGGPTNGGVPYAGLIFDASGNLYGTASVGGQSSGCENMSSCGLVFSLNPNGDGSWKEHILHAFTGGRDGGNPYGDLIFDAAGNIYGTTAAGGGSTSCSGGCGTVFVLKPKSNGKWTESVLHRFNNDEGANPYAGLTFDTDGNLYGATVNGGSTNAGLIFKLKPRQDGSWDYSVVFDLDGALGENPYGTPIFNKADKKLYDTTLNCVEGGQCRGIVFEVTP